MRPQYAQFAWRPKAGKAIIGLIAALVACYVLQLLLLRANVSFVKDLYLSPAGVFDRYLVFQPFTYLWLHNPESLFHLLLNGVFLWMFGSPMEHRWGTRRFLIAYLICGLAGGALTLLFGLLTKTDAFGPLLGTFWSRPHLGASGAVMGITIAWGLTFANEEMNFLFIGRMKGKTFVLIMVAFELIRALAFDPISSTSHFGGMAAGSVLVLGLWRPGRWKTFFQKQSLQRKKRKIEKELRVIQGGKQDDDDDDQNGSGKGNGSSGTIWN